EDLSGSIAGQGGSQDTTLPCAVGAVPLILAIAEVRQPLDVGITVEPSACVGGVHQQLGETCRFQCVVDHLGRADELERGRGVLPSPALRVVDLGPGDRLEPNLAYALLRAAVGERTAGSGEAQPCIETA